MSALRIRSKDSYSRPIESGRLGLRPDQNCARTMERTRNATTNVITGAQMSERLGNRFQGKQQVVGIVH